jgi:hypothetical protein
MFAAGEYSSPLASARRMKAMQVTSASLFSFLKIMSKRHPGIRASRQFGNCRADTRLIDQSAVLREERLQYTELDCAILSLA